MVAIRIASAIATVAAFDAADKVRRAKRSRRTWEWYRKRGKILAIFEWTFGIVWPGSKAPYLG